MEQTKLYHLVQAIQLVALECAQQTQILPNFVAVPDEIATSLNDTILAFEDSEELASLDSRIFDKIKRLDEYFYALEKGEFTLEALCNSPRWALSRDMAKEILTMLGLHTNKPDLSWMRFIKGAS